MTILKQNIIIEVHSQNQNYNNVMILLLVPDIENAMSNSIFPPGLTLIENFVTKEQEETLLRTLDWEKCGKIY